MTSIAPPPPDGIDDLADDGVTRRLRLRRRWRMPRIYPDPLTDGYHPRARIAYAVALLAVALAMIGTLGVLRLVGLGIGGLLWWQSRRGVGVVVELGRAGLDVWSSRGRRVAVPLWALSHFEAAWDGERELEPPGVDASRRRSLALDAAGPRSEGALDELGSSVRVHLRWADVTLAIGWKLGHPAPSARWLAAELNRHLEVLRVAPVRADRPDRRQTQ